MKKQVIAELSHQLNARLDEFNVELRSLQESLAEDTKSSAGDKFETSREMTQQEINKLEGQLTMCLNNLSELAKMSLVETDGCVRQGSLVTTSTGKYFVAFAHGKVMIGNDPVFVLSLESPVGALMNGLKKGDKFSFNMREFQILEVE
ncbi:MAG: hypothetical protein GC193_03830 [Cryomorphaceae bacterium]|nr:hypothetical protein [Cryomorphaceae bacterium]